MGGEDATVLYAGAAQEFVAGVPQAVPTQLKAGTATTAASLMVTIH